MAVDDVLRRIEQGKIRGGFGEIARRLRESEGYTRGRLAVEMYRNKGYSGYIFEMEMGRRTASNEMIMKYTSYFSIPKKHILKIVELEAEHFKQTKRKDLLNVLGLNK